MSDEPKNNIKRNPELEYEHQDLSAMGVYTFLAGIAVAGLVIYFVLWGMYRYLDYYERTHQPPQNPLVQTEADTRVVPPQAVQKFPQPRLEKNERTEINDFRLKEEQTLNSYDWIDQKSGVVRIPIDRAMKLIAQRGLPTTPRVGTVPPSEVNVVNQAAQRADVSNLPKNQSSGKTKQK
jgi:hypothetical protein